MEGVSIVLRSCCFISFYLLRVRALLCSVALILGGRSVPFLAFNLVLSSPDDVTFQEWKWGFVRWIYDQTEGQRAAKVSRAGVQEQVILTIHTSAGRWCWRHCLVHFSWSWVLREEWEEGRDGRWEERMAAILFGDSSCILGWPQTHCIDEDVPLQCPG